MAGTATPIYPQTIKSYPQTISNSDASTLKTLTTPGANGSRIYSIGVTSTDTAARDLILYVVASSVNYPIGMVSIPANSGNANNIPTVDLLRSVQNAFLSYDPMGNKVLDLGSGDVLSVAAATTVTSGKQITIFGQGGDF